MTLTMKSFFRALAASFSRESTAQAVAGIGTLVLVLYTGYTIPNPSMWVELLVCVRIQLMSLSIGLVLSSG